MLDALRGGGLRTGILTNASAATLDAVAADRPGRRSRPVGRRRAPVQAAPAVYELGTNATGLPADRIGFVTGNGWDAAGAGTFGFRVAWLRPPALCRPRRWVPEPIEQRGRCGSPGS